jgi:hypothetical protein
MTEVLVKEQVVAQRDWFAPFWLLEQIVEVLERSSPQQMGVIPMEGPVAEEIEVVPVVIADVEWAQTLLFLRDSDPMDMPFALLARIVIRTWRAAVGVRRAVMMTGPLGL